MGYSSETAKNKKTKKEMVIYLATMAATAIGTGVTVFVANKVNAPLDTVSKIEAGGGALFLTELALFHSSVAATRSQKKG